MTCLNASLLDGEHRSLAANGVASADVLLIVKRSKGTMDFAATEAPRLVILGDPEQMAALQRRFGDAVVLPLEESCFFFLK